MIRGKDGKLRQLPLGGTETVEMQPDSKELPPQDLQKDVQTIIDILHKVAAQKIPMRFFVNTAMRAWIPC